MLAPRSAVAGGVGAPGLKLGHFASVEAACAHYHSAFSSRRVAPLMVDGVLDSPMD